MNTEFHSTSNHSEKLTPDQEKALHNQVDQALFFRNPGRVQSVFTSEEGRYDSVQQFITELLADDDEYLSKVLGIDAKHAQLVKKYLVELQKETQKISEMDKILYLSRSYVDSFEKGLLDTPPITLQNIIDFLHELREEMVSYVPKTQDQKILLAHTHQAFDMIARILHEKYAMPLAEVDENVETEKRVLQLYADYFTAITQDENNPDQKVIIDGIFSSFDGSKNYKVIADVFSDVYLLQSDIRNIKSDNPTTYSEIQTEIEKLKSEIERKDDIGENIKKALLVLVNRLEAQTFAYTKIDISSFDQFKAIEVLSDEDKKFLKDQLESWVKIEGIIDVTEELPSGTDNINERIHSFYLVSCGLQPETPGSEFKSRDTLRVELKRISQTYHGDKKFLLIKKLLKNLLIYYESIVNKAKILLKEQIDELGDVYLPDVQDWIRKDGANRFLWQASRRLWGIFAHINKAGKPDGGVNLFTQLDKDEIDFLLTNFEAKKNELITNIANDDDDAGNLPVNNKLRIEATQIQINRLLKMKKGILSLETQINEDESNNESREIKVNNNFKLIYELIQKYINTDLPSLEEFLSEEKSPKFRQEFMKEVNETIFKVFSEILDEHLSTSSGVPLLDKGAPVPDLWTKPLGTLVDNPSGIKPNFETFFESFPMELFFSDKEKELSPKEIATIKAKLILQYKYRCGAMTNELGVPAIWGSDLSKWQDVDYVDTCIKELVAKGYTAELFGAYYNVNFDEKNPLHAIYGKEDTAWQLGELTLYIQTQLHRLHKKFLPINQKKKAGYEEVKKEIKDGITKEFIISDTLFDTAMNMAIFHFMHSFEHILYDPEGIDSKGCFIFEIGCYVGKIGDGSLTTEFRAPETTYTAIERNMVTPAEYAQIAIGLSLESISNEDRILTVDQLKKLEVDNPDLFLNLAKRSHGTTLVNSESIYVKILAVYDIFYIPKEMCMFNQRGDAVALPKIQRLDILRKHSHDNFMILSLDQLTRSGIKPKYVYFSSMTSNIAPSYSNLLAQLGLLRPLTFLNPNSQDLPYGDPRELAKKKMRKRPTSRKFKIPERWRINLFKMRGNSMTPDEIIEFQKSVMRSFSMEKLDPNEIAEQGTEDAQTLRAGRMFKALKYAFGELLNGSRAIVGGKASVLNTEIFTILLNEFNVEIFYAVSTDERKEVLRNSPMLQSIRFILDEYQRTLESEKYDELELVEKALEVSWPLVVFYVSYISFTNFQQPKNPDRDIVFTFGDNVVDTPNKTFGGGDVLKPSEIGVLIKFYDFIHYKYVENFIKEETARRQWLHYNKLLEANNIDPNASKNKELANQAKLLAEEEVAKIVKLIPVYNTELYLEYLKEFGILGSRAALAKAIEEIASFFPK